MNLDDESLLNFCKTAVKEEYEKSLCADETFWKLRTENYYPVAYEIKKDDLKWKKYYLRIVYYKDKMEREYGFGFTDGDAKEYYNILSMGAPFRNPKAKELGYEDLIKYTKTDFDGEIEEFHFNDEIGEFNKIDF